MNIHEHQAKKILKKYGANVPEGDFAFTVKELIEKAKKIKTEKYVLKAQIHAGGRGKAGGVKILNNISLEHNDFSFCPELTTKISNLNIKIKELPIFYKGRNYEEGKKITFFDGIIAIYTILKFKLK